MAHAEITRVFDQPETTRVFATLPALARLQPKAETQQRKLPAAGPFDVAHEPHRQVGTLNTLATSLLVMYPVAASVLVVLVGLMLVGPAAA